MTMTTLGSQHAAQTVEGRIALILAVYTFAVFGYVTATLAGYLVGRDAENPEAERAGAKEITALRQELAALPRRTPGIAGADSRRSVNAMPG